MKSIVKSNTVFTVIDLETSHYHPDHGGMIIELAAVKIENDKIVDKRNQLINPQRAISAKITEITTITNPMLKNQPVYQNVLPKFHKFIGDSVIVAHNASFDWDRFLLHFFKKLGIYPTNQVVDTLKLSKELLKAESYNLGNLCASLDIVHTHQHRALGDALATAELFLHLKHHYIDKNEAIQPNLFTEAESTPVLKPQEVRKVVYWEKDLPGRTLKRIYVTLSGASVFYDISTGAWEVKSTNGPINFYDVKSQVANHLKVETFDDAIRKMIRVNASRKS